MSMLMISVLTVTHGRDRSLRSHLESLVRADRFSDVRVKVLINGPDLQAVDILNEYAQRYHNISFIQGSRCSKGKARNILMAESQGCDIFYFLDDDCQVAQDAFTILMDMGEAHPAIECFGGPNLTCAGDSVFARAQGHALGSFFGALWVRDRYRVHGDPRIVDERSLILCNLAIRCQALARSGVVFNEALACAEENLLIRDLIAAGCRCMHIPWLRVFHERRRTMAGFCRQMFIYGLGKCQVVQKNPFFLWMMKVWLLLACSALWLLVVPWVRSLLTMAGCLYVISGIFAAVWIAGRERDLRIFWHLLYIFPAIHIGYGLGFIWGIVTVVDNRMYA